MPETETEHTTPADLPDQRREAVESILCDMLHGLQVLCAAAESSILAGNGIKWAAVHLSEQVNEALDILDPAALRGVA
ncbi:hypothetical protein [Acidocella sp.]|uniref:hypothetical protein n=1 Tax=Acidocella sp. TaxID=50710 RepID=UPI00261B6787|nr:hypothetical protein [Acidocella sp.]